jgi:excisionase family DNA binding protein
VLHPTAKAAPVVLIGLEAAAWRILMNFHGFPPAAPAGDPPYLAHSIPRACQISGLARSTLYESAAQGRLTFRKIGRKTLVRHDDLKRLISELPPANIRQKTAI